MSDKIPMDTYRLAVQEPCKLDMMLEGESVQPRRLHVGFNARAIERFAESHDFMQVMALMERVSGIGSFAHTLALFQAMEELTGVIPPPRARYVRVVMAELERLHSHVQWAGAAARLMGFKTTFMACIAIREKVMDVLQAVSGNRGEYCMNLIGGVNRNIEDPVAILHMVEELEGEMALKIIPVLTTSATALSRCAGIGVLNHAKAVSYGVVGPIARASGVDQDIRRDVPYGAYEEMDFNVPVEKAGDVRARLMVRALEILESCRILRQALGKIPRGAVNTGETKIAFSGGTVHSRAEAPEGEVIFSVTWKENARNPSRIQVRTPAEVNMPAARWMLRGARLSDAPLIRASIDPCSSGAGRQAGDSV
jgi:ech hydrogenase subunit E